jgi:ubiquinol-cytochrome c reductase cytochrome c subunit
MSARAATARKRLRRRSKSFRRITGGLALLCALVAMGFAYAAFSPHTQSASAAATDAAQVAEGKQLYENSCITCHGANLQGVLDRGPSLIGVGDAAVYFQVSTGRMPAVQNGAQNPRKEPVFNEDQVNALGAYVQANGGGPQVPTNDSDLKDIEQRSLGGELYRLNCASCHNFTGQGGALSQGKYAPNLDQATDKEIYAAMLSGPENMPKFGDGQLTPDQKKAIVAFIQNNKATVDPGGYSLGGFGPAPEGLVAFLVGMGAIVALTLWMGSRA